MPIDVAVLPGNGPANALDNTAALLAALRSQGLLLGEVHDRLPDALAARSDRPIALLPASLRVSSVPLGAVLDDPRLRTAALAEVRPGGARTGDAGPDAELLCVVRLDAADRVVAARLDPPDLISLVTGLQQAGVPVAAVPLTGYVWAQPRDAAEVTAAQAAITALPERRIRLREAARGGDGFYSTFVLRKVSWRCTDLALRAGLTPNAVTLASFATGLAAAACIATGARAWTVLGAVLLQWCLVVDCVDGELARFRRRFSRFGAWLDATTDRVKEFAVVAALAVASHQMHRQGHPVWGLAALAVGVQTFRNLFELAWAIQREYLNPPRPVRVRWLPASVRFRANPIARPDAGFDWWRRLGHFPVGERFLLISIGAALWTPRGTLGLLVGLGLLSAAYMLAAFAVRGRSGAMPAPRLLAMLDRGQLARRGVSIRARRFAVLQPAALAALELALLWALTRGAAEGAALGLVVAAAIAHYQHVYGIREQAGRARRWTLGALGRLVLAAVLAVLGAPSAWVWALAGLVALDTLIGAVLDWRVVAPQPDPRPAPEVV